MTTTEISGASVEAKAEFWLRRKTWLIIVGGFTLFALADGLQISLVLDAVGRPPRWRLMTLRTLAFWLTFVAWMPAVLFLASRFRLTWPLPWGRILIHAVGSCSFSIVQLASAVWLDPIRERTASGFYELFALYVMRHAGQDVLAYWAVVGAFYTIHYYRESRHSQVKAAQLESLLADAKLRALRAQLNPHFLFNTLNTITVLSRKGDQAAVTGMLTRLSTLLRIALDEALPQEIPLSKELAFLEGYLDIQKIRFADRLTISRQIEPETLAGLVPCMILQPLVENAVVHGVSHRTGAGAIGIQAWQRDGALQIRISDNGPGFHHEGAARRRGIGLANTEARLETLYGRAQRIECDESADGGVVAISIPFHTEAVHATAMLGGVR